MARVYLRSLLVKVSDMDKSKRGFYISKSEVGTMLEHLQLVEIELQTLNVEKHLFENICLKMKKNSLCVCGRRMQERQIELEKMKRKFQESQTETGFLRNIFRNISTTRDAEDFSDGDSADNAQVADADDLDDLSEGEDSSSIVPTSANDPRGCTEKDGADVMAGVYLRSLLEKLSDMEKCKRGFYICESEVGMMLEHLQLVEIELQTLNVEKHLLEDICLKMKKKSLGILGRRMQERQIELEKMKRKFQESQTETGFLRNIFRNIGATRNAAGPDAEDLYEGDSADNEQATDSDDLDDLDDFSEDEDSSSTFPTSVTNQLVCTEWDSEDDGQAADADDLDDFFEGEEFSTIFPTSATDKWVFTEGYGAKDAQAADADDLDDFSEHENPSSTFLTSATDQSEGIEWDSEDGGQDADADDFNDLPEGQDSSSILPTSTTDQWVCTEGDGAKDAQAADADDLHNLPEGEDSSSILPTSATDPQGCTGQAGADDVLALHGAYSGWLMYRFSNGQTGFFYNPPAGKDGKDPALPDD